MFSHQTVKRVISLLSILIATTAAGIVGYGQCTGVYSRHTSTRQLPYSKVYLDIAADITGDGKVDLLASQNLATFSDSIRNRILIVPGNGDGTFGTPTAIDAPTDFDETYTIAKVNNDALYDIIAFAGYSTDPVTMLVYINNGNGTFTPKPPVSAAGMGKPVDFADLNGDGKTDYVGFLSVGNGHLQYSLGNGDGTFSPSGAINSFASGFGGDFNGDGKRDYYGYSDRTIYLNNGNLTFTPLNLSPMFTPGDTLWTGLDANADGKTDLLVINFSATRSFSIFTSTGTGFTRTDYPITSDPTTQVFTHIGNFSGNSATDIVFSEIYKNKKIVFTNDGAGNFTRQDLDQRLYSPKFLRSLQADFNNDGKDDFIQVTSGITNSLLLLKDITSITFLKTVCDRPGQPRIIDLDGTGNTDLSFWDPATGAWSMRSYIIPGGYGPSETSTVNWGLGSLGDIPTPGDFDGDGVPDRAIYRDSTGFWYVRRSSDQVWFVMQFGLPGDKPVVADYDGDTISDIAVWRPSDGTWYFSYMGTQQFGAVRWGMDGDKPVPADFDGDLKADIAVFRPSTGVWYTLKSSDSSFTASIWGLSTDKPIPADYDGDGKADVTIYRESNGVVYIMRSSNATASYYQWGSPGDIFQIGDFDGDYVADLGVFRPSVGGWWAPNYFALGAYGNAGSIPTSSILRVE